MPTIKTPYTDKSLAEFQQQWLELLQQHTTSTDLKLAVEQSHIQDDLKRWLLETDPDMLETAASLVKKWGSKEVSDGVGDNLDHPE